VKDGQIIGDMIKFGIHDRAVVYNRHAKYNRILQAEMPGELIEILPNAQEGEGQLLVMGMRHPREIPSSTDILPVAASSRVRDQVRSVLRDYVLQRARLAVFEYEP
jgi:hypothetical protein